MHLAEIHRQLSSGDMARIPCEVSVQVLSSFFRCFQTWWSQSVGMLSVFISLVLILCSQMSQGG